MKALITGASSGMGRDMARVLSGLGYDIIAVARRSERLEQLKKELKTNVEIICCDVSDEQQCRQLAGIAGDVDVVVNNAGFGVFGDFCSNDLDAELKLIDTNLKAVHIITKEYTRRFKEKNSGYILNVASAAAFFPGPLFAAYYASKSYVLRLSQSIAEEMRREKKNVHISVLCPGPVSTEFGEVANVSFGIKGKGISLESMDVARYAIKQMFSGKQVIVPGAVMKAAVFLRHILPDKALARAVYHIQHKKCSTK